MLHSIVPDARAFPGALGTSLRTVWKNSSITNKAAIWPDLTPGWSLVLGAPMGSPTCLPEPAPLAASTCVYPGTAGPTPVCLMTCWREGAPSPPGPGPEAPHSTPLAVWLAGWQLCACGLPTGGRGTCEGRGGDQEEMGLSPACGRSSLEASPTPGLSSEPEAGTLGRSLPAGARAKCPRRTFPQPFWQGGVGMAWGLGA